MSKQITIEEVRHMANLSRLVLSDEEEKLFTSQLGQIVEHMNVLNGVPTEGIEPLYTPIQIIGSAREDAPVDMRDRSQILANAPDTDGICFIVPKIV